MKVRFFLAAVFWFALISFLRADASLQAVQQTLKEQGFYYGAVSGEMNAETTAAIRRYQIRNGLQITGELNEETLKAIGVGKPSPPSNTQTVVPAPAPTMAPPAMRQDDEDDAEAPEAIDPAIPVQPGPEQIYEAPAPNLPVMPPAAVRSAEIFIGTPYDMAPPELQRQIVFNAQSLLAQLGLYRNPVDGLYGPGTEFSIRAYQAENGLAVTGRLDMETLASLRLLPHQRRPGMFPRPRYAPVVPPRPVVRGEWIPE